VVAVRRVSNSRAGSVYVTNTTGVSQYDIGPDGTLTPESSVTVPVVASGSRSALTVRAGTSPAARTSIALTPDGKNAYVANNGDDVTQYNVDPVTGALSPKGPATVVAGPSPVDVAVTPDGKNATSPSSELA
jgi:DNA-binding beta-propeller fold protein YncE